MEQVAAACITCAALALAQGGFEMLDLVAACSVARRRDEAETLEVCLTLFLGEAISSSA